MVLGGIFLVPWENFLGGCSKIRNIRTRKNTFAKFGYTDSDNRTIRVYGERTARTIVSGRCSRVVRGGVYGE